MAMSKDTPIVARLPELKSEEIIVDIGSWTVDTLHIHEKIRKNQIGGFASNPAPHGKPSGGGWLIR